MSAEALNIRDILDANPIVGEMRAGPKRFWTGREVKIVRDHFPSGGLPACLPLLPGRTASAIYDRAGQLGLHSSAKGKAGIPQQRWTASDAIDGVIRRAYQRTPTKGSIKQLARTIGRPLWWTTRRAAKLGLAVPRFKALPWSEAEDSFVTENAHRDPSWLSRRLRALGHQRTETAVSVRAKRLGASTVDPDHHTARGLASLMGVEVKAVTRWIANGWLKAARRGTDRVAAQGGDEWWIHRRDVRRFVIENVSAIDVRKVEKFWFVDLLAELPDPRRKVRHSHLLSDINTSSTSLNPPNPAGVALVP